MRLLSILLLAVCVARANEDLTTREFESLLALVDAGNVNLQKRASAAKALKGKVPAKHVNKVAALVSRVPASVRPHLFAALEPLGLRSAPALGVARQSLHTGGGSERTAAANLIARMGSAGRTAGPDLIRNLKGPLATSRAARKALAATGLASVNRHLLTFEKTLVTRSGERVQVVESVLFLGRTQYAIPLARILEHELLGASISRALRETVDRTEVGHVLRSWAESKDPTTRWAAAIVLGRLARARDRKALGLVGQLADDRSPRVRLAAQEAASRLRRR